MWLVSEGYCVVRPGWHVRCRLRDRGQIEADLMEVGADSEG